MKANELRIGNWYEMNGNNFWLEMRWMYQWASGILPIEDIKPIPLTEEWLKKFGFEKHPNKKEYLIFGFGGSIIVEIKTNFYVLRTIDNVSICSIKHIHQLQNLYFALTGEELQIND